MTVTYSLAAADARLALGLIASGTTAGASVDGQSGDGLLVIGTSALSGATGVLATITLSKPSFSVAAKVATLNGVPLTASPTANGTAALAELRDSSSNTVISTLTVGTSGTDIIVSTTTFTTTVPVQVTAGTITTN